jgi:T5orf172 domain
MAKHTPDGSRFKRTDAIAQEYKPPTAGMSCAWQDCNQQQWMGLPVCVPHMFEIAWFVGDLRDTFQKDRGIKPPSSPEPPKPKYVSYIYYLMRGPNTVKIGSTTTLAERMHALYTEVQYVVAIEYGDRKLEHQRHQEFAGERIKKRREDFHLSDRLRAHISALQPQRDELVQQALMYPRQQCKVTEVNPLAEDEPVDSVKLAMAEDLFSNPTF